jgi:hypothetical protein
MIDPRPEDMTVLCSVNRLLMTKNISLHRKTGKVIKSAYGNEKHFSVRTVELAGFTDLAARLTTMTAQRHAFVVRGEPLPDTNREKTRRLLHPDLETGEAATFMGAARTWFAIDLDKIKRPVAMDPVVDPEGAIEHLIGLLPPELHDASCWWQFTCSQNLPGCADTLSARLWFWNREPLDDASLTRWALAANKAAGRKLVDPALYRAVQPHYTADPIFEGGMVDPVPRRCGTRAGLDESVSLVIPEPDPADPHSYTAGGFVGLGVDAFLAEIGGDRGFRAPMVSAIASYFALDGPDADPGLIKDRVRRAIVATPNGGRSDNDIKRYLSDRHLNEIIGWVRQHERANPHPRRAAADLKTVANSVPVAEERASAVRAIAASLIRCDSIPARLALSLAEAWNEEHCAPPLPRDQVRAIVNALAGRQAARVESRNGR